MGIKNLEPNPVTLTDHQIRQIIISYVHNNASIDFSDDEGGLRFETFKRIYLDICKHSHFDKKTAAIWMEWGTREGFTII